MTELIQKANKLFFEEGIVKAQIIDGEIDPLNCYFNNDGCVIIDTKKYTYITLSKENLKELLKLINDAGNKFNTL